jgi:fructokinase
MRTFITSMGDCLIDFLPLQPDDQTTGFRMYPGGSLLNVAVGIARLGPPVAFASKLANDYFGRYLRAYIDKNGIDTRYLATTEALSTLAFVTMEAKQASFAFYGDGTADTLMTMDDVPASLFEETSILHVGSTSLLRGTTPDTIRATFEQIKGKALLSLDPNIRPQLVKDEAKYRALLQHLISLTDVLKLSDADLDWLLPGQSVETAMQTLIEQGPAIVIVTLGANGAAAIKKDEAILRIPGFAVEVNDTIGAGDTFCAGLLTALTDHNILTRATLAEITAEQLRAILRFAAGAAALDCTREGADPPTRAELEHFLTTHSG